MPWQCGLQVSGEDTIALRPRTSRVWSLCLFPGHRPRVAPVRDPSLTTGPRSMLAARTQWTPCRRGPRRSETGLNPPCTASPFSGDRAPSCFGTVRANARLGTVASQLAKASEVSWICGVTGYARPARRPRWSNGLRSNLACPSGPYQPISGNPGPTQHRCADGPQMDAVVPCHPRGWPHCQRTNARLFESISFQEMPQTTTVAGSSGSSVALAPSLPDFSSSPCGTRCSKSPRTNGMLDSTLWHVPSPPFVSVALVCGVSEPRHVS